MIQKKKKKTSGWQPGRISHQVNFLDFNCLLLIQQEAVGGPGFCPRAVFGDTWKSQNTALGIKRDGERGKIALVRFCVVGMMKMLRLWEEKEEERKEEEKMEEEIKKGEKGGGEKGEKGGEGEKKGEK